MPLLYCHNKMNFRKKYFGISCLVFFFFLLDTASAQEVNINRIIIRPSNIGGLDYNHEPQSMWDGWDKNISLIPFIYNQGLWVTGKKNGGYGCVPTLWNSSVSPGPILNGQPAIKITPQDAFRYRVYTITAGETPEMNPDINSWPADLGAPVDSLGKPRILGDQTAWTVCNGADTTLYPYFFGNRKLSPRVLLPVEIRETIFEHFGEINDTSIWANTVFFEWGIFNKGIDALDSVYLSFWTDIDMALFYSSDIPAVDTLLQTGYTWYRKDSSYASTGYTLLFGPSVPSTNDTAIFFGKKKFGYKNLPLSSFRGIADDSFADSSNFGPPYSLGTAWNVVRGLNQNGKPIIDSLTKKSTTFPYSGDPITRQGSQWPTFASCGAGFMMTTGPITIAPGDSQWMMIVLIPNVKLNGVDAINRMRANAQYLRSLPYDSLVSRKPRRNVPIKQLPNFTVPATFKLYSNYPNPFNGQTMIPFDLPERSTVTIEIFDVIGRSIASLPNQIFDKGTQSVRWFPAASAGVYFVRVNAVSLESTSKWSGLNKVLLLR
jgi:hypothetical protein